MANTADQPQTSGSAFTSVQWPPRRWASCDWRTVLQPPPSPDLRPGPARSPLCRPQKTEAWPSSPRDQGGSAAEAVWLQVQSRGWSEAGWGWGWWGWPGRGWPEHPRSRLGPPLRWSLRQTKTQFPLFAFFVSDKKNEVMCVYLEAASQLFLTQTELKRFPDKRKTYDDLATNVNTTTRTDGEVSLPCWMFSGVVFHSRTAVYFQSHPSFCLYPWTISWKKRTIIHQNTHTQISNR